MSAFGEAAPRPWRIVHEKTVTHEIVSAQPPMYRILKACIRTGVVTEALPGFDDADVEAAGVELRRLIDARFRRSLAIRQVDAGSCNGCELEIHEQYVVFCTCTWFGWSCYQSRRPVVADQGGAGLGHHRHLARHPAHEAPTRCMISASGVIIGRQPRARARRHRSASSPYM